MKGVRAARLRRVEHGAVALGGVTREVLRPPLRVCATAVMTCCTMMLPVCLKALFQALSPQQRQELANIIVTDLADAAHNNQPIPHPAKKEN